MNPASTSPNHAKYNRQDDVTIQGRVSWILYQTFPSEMSEWAKQLIKTERARHFRKKKYRLARKLPPPQGTARASVLLAGDLNQFLSLEDEKMTLFSNGGSYIQGYVYMAHFTVNGAQLKLYYEP